jgi:hypothetical protein
MSEKSGKPTQTRPGIHNNSYCQKLFPIGLPGFSGIPRQIYQGKYQMDSPIFEKEKNLAANE